MHPSNYLQILLSFVFQNIFIYLSLLSLISNLSRFILILKTLLYVSKPCVYKSLKYFRVCLSDVCFSTPIYFCSLFSPAHYHLVTFVRKRRKMASRALMLNAKSNFSSFSSFTQIWCKQLPNFFPFCKLFKEDWRVSVLTVGNLKF